MESNIFDFHIDSKILPEKFRNVIISNDNEKLIKIRSSLKDMKDIKEWVAEFGEKSFTKWNARTSIPHGQKIVCSKKFVCQHNAFMKVKPHENKKGLSKNANCTASLLIIIKLDTRSTRKRDPFVKDGLRAVITIYNDHCHTLRGAESLKFLKSSSKVKEAFLNYFSDRMTISEAIKYHQSLFQNDDPETRDLFLASGSQNPTYRTVQYWYDQWRKLNLVPRTESQIIEVNVAKNMHSILPPEYPYRILSAEQSQNPPFKSLILIIAVKLHSKEEALDWLENYQNLNHVTLRVTKTYEESTPQKMFFKREFGCCPNAYQRVDGKACFKTPTTCAARIAILIKNVDSKRLSNDFLRPYACEINIRHTHNHPLRKQPLLQQPSPAPQEVVYELQRLFERGHSPTSALAIHNDSGKQQGHALSYKTTFDLYFKQYKKAFSEKTTREELVDSLKKFIKEYNERCGDKCAALLADQKQVTVVVCSPAMKRIHQEIEEAGEVMYIDSSPNGEFYDLRVMLLLCPSPVGMLPLGLIFIYAQREKVIESGFHLLQTILPAKAFFNKWQYPKVIICEEEDKSCLQKVFKHSRLLISHFSTLQRALRQIWLPGNGLSRTDRSAIYTMFVKAFNCTQAHEFKRNYDRLLEEVSTCKKVHHYLNRMQLSAADWTVFSRRKLIKEKYLYPERAFRILKDTILVKTKLFDIAQLFDYATSSFETCYFKSILDFMQGDLDKPSIDRQFSVDVGKLDDLRCDKLGCDLYKVCQLGDDMDYIVNYQMECCSCMSGKWNTSCKHQIAVTNKFNIPQHNWEALTDDDYVTQTISDILKGKGADAQPRPPCITKEEVADQLNEFVQKVMDKYNSDPYQFKKPVESFVKNLETNLNTDALLAEALQNFGCDRGEHAFILKPPTLVQMQVQGDDDDDEAVVNNLNPPKKLKLLDYSYSMVEDDGRKQPVGNRKDLMPLTVKVTDIEGLQTYNNVNLIPVPYSIVIAGSNNSKFKLK